MNANTARARAHPLRVRILELLAAGEVRSPNEIAISTGEPLGNVSYHVKRLVCLGMVELESTAPRRGAVEHFYRLTPAARKTQDDTEILDQIAEVLRSGQPQSGHIVRNLVESTGRAAREKAAA